MTQVLGKEMGTELVSWAQMQKKAELHDCVTPTREDHGIVASLWFWCYR